MTMESQNLIETSTYQKALSGGVYLNQPDVGLLHLEGRDQVDFLQRQTSNDLNLLSSERSLVTVLLNPAARILDVLRLIKSDNAVEALTLPGYAAETTRFLKSRIFFMDQVSVADQSDLYHQIDLIGVEAPAILERIDFSNLPGVDEVARSQIAGNSLLAIGFKSFPGPSFHLVVPVNAGQDLQSALQSSGAEAMSEDVYHLLRIESGLPAAGHELTADYTPLEAGLAQVVSTSKGCYPGQEVIARQTNYDKITRSLVGLRLEGQAEAGARITVDGKMHGTVTSFANSPRFGPIALGILKRPFNQPGTPVMVTAASSDQEVPAQVSALPFDSNTANRTV